MESMSKRPEVYNASLNALTELSKEGKALVIRPEKIQGISRTERDPRSLDMLYNQGIEVGNKRLPEILKFIGRN